MPIIKIVGIHTNEMIPISMDFQARLALIFKTSEENITIQVFNSEVLSCGKIDKKPYPQIEVQLFDRPKEQKQEAAKYISKIFNEIGYPDSDVYFTRLEREYYFVNGELM